MRWWGRDHQEDCRRRGTAHGPGRRPRAGSCATTPKNPVEKYRLLARSIRTALRPPLYVRTFTGMGDVVPARIGTRVLLPVVAQMSPLPSIAMLGISPTAPVTSV